MAKCGWCGEPGHNWAGCAKRKNGERADFETRIRANERERIAADLEAQAEWCAKQAENMSAQFGGRWPSDQECLVLSRYIASRDGYREAAGRVRAGS